MWVSKKILIVTFFLGCLLNVHGKEKEEDPYAKLKKKSLVDYNEADLELLYDQWEEADEPLEEDELPPHKRPRPNVDMSQLNPSKPEDFLKKSKKGQTLMMFATVAGEPSQLETEEITKIWQTGLYNAHYDIQRYVVGQDRVLFMLQDGSKAWEVRDFLIEQERCESVTIENQDYPGKGFVGKNEKIIAERTAKEKRAAKRKAREEAKAKELEEKAKTEENEEL